MELFQNISQQTNPQVNPAPQPVPVKKELEPSAVSILHGFRKEAEEASRKSLKLFMLFMFILIFDVAALVISWQVIGEGAVTDIAAAGMYGLVALTGYLLVEVRRAKKRVKDIDSFYMEYSIKNNETA